MQHTAITQSNAQMLNKTSTVQPIVERQKVGAKDALFTEKEEQKGRVAFSRILQIKANRDLAKRTAAALTVLFIYLIFVFTTLSYRESPRLVIAFGVLLFFTVAARVVVAKRATTDDILASQEWLRQYSLATLSMSAVWAGFVTAIFVCYQTGWVSLLAVLSTAGIAAAATSSIAPNAKLARSYVLIMVAPIIVMGLVEGTRPSVTLSVMLSIFIGALMLMIKDNNQLFWSSLSTIERLNLQKVDLEQVILKVAENSGELKDASVGLSAISSNMSQKADAMSADSSRVAGATQEFHDGSKHIASSMTRLTDKTDQVVNAIEGMTVTINDLSKTIQDTQSIAAEAVRQADGATRKVSELGNWAKAVGKISETIKEISEQTNLLALNATIEAARAGEAGKGFSVVANEIKDLAGQTAEATLQIKNQIDAFQNVISETVAEIGRIAAITTEINQSVTASADSVQKQSKTTTIMAASVGDASKEIMDIGSHVINSSKTAENISEGISEVSLAASEVATNSAQVDQNADTLMRLANALNDVVQSARNV